MPKAQSLIYLYDTRNTVNDIVERILCVCVGIGKRMMALGWNDKETQIEVYRAHLSEPFMFFFL